MNDADRLQGYVAGWWQAIDDFTTLLEELPAEQWSAPTDLDGWDVRAVAAHIAHLEGLLAGVPQAKVEIGEPAHVTSPMGAFTEEGVVARRDHDLDAIVNEIRESATKRHTALLADPPTDGSVPAPGVFAALGWDLGTLLRNRLIDVWMHEQDVRRAVDLPGGMDSIGAQQVTDALLESLPFVLGKRVAAPAGTTAVLSVPGSDPVAARIGEDGRGVRIEAPSDPQVRIAMDRESFIVTAGGRREPAGPVQIEGDRELGMQILANLAVTP